jgi:HEXXH motif-containing protein
MTFAVPALTTHVVASSTFDALARGHGGLDDQLQAGQRSKRLLLLSELRASVEKRMPRQAAESGWSSTFDTLVTAQRHARPDVDELLLLPHVGAWAAHCLRTLMTDELSPADLGHSGAIAAMAASRAETTCEVRAYVRDGRVMFPGLGAALVPGGDGWCRLRTRRGLAGVELTTEGAGPTDITFSPSPGSSWRPLHRLRVTHDDLTLDVVLDDLDSYRGCGHLPVMPATDDADVRRWKDVVEPAWHLLVSDHRVVAATLASSLCALVPMARDSDDAPHRSATCAQSLGAVTLTMPATPLQFAAVLAHELQHAKLSTLMDLVPLVDEHADGLYRSPWRADPRPTSGLLQGAYAWLALADIWTVRLSRGPITASDSHGLVAFEWALARRQLRAGLATLTTAGELTGPGRRFTKGMLQRLVELEASPVPRAADRLAALVCRDNITSWRLRNLRPDTHHVNRGAAAWLAGHSCTPADVAGPTAMSDSGGPIASDDRLALLRRRLAGAQNEVSVTLADDRDGLRSGDAAIVAGQPGRAVDAYRRALASDPDDLAAWSGLALATAGESDGSAAWALSRRPELVYALHRAIRLRRGMAPDPVHLAEWVGSAAR